MTSNYDSYSYMKNSQDKIKQKQTEFFKVLEKFKHCEYEDRIKIMKELWGDIKENTTIKYTDLCSIEISIDSTKKYHFKFDCKLIELNYLKSISEEIANEAFDLVKDDVQKFQKEEMERMEEQQKLSKNIEQLSEMNKINKQIHMKK